MAPSRRNRGSGGPPRRPTPLTPPKIQSQSSEFSAAPVSQPQGNQRSDLHNTTGRLTTPLFDSLQFEATHHNEPVAMPLENIRRVPMEYRAQVQGRCQRQYISKQKSQEGSSDIQKWIDEWVERVDNDIPFKPAGLHIVEAQIDWRLLSNSGVDEGFIRPVIGARGWPIIPGSGIKGLFRRACPPKRLNRWCGGSFGADDLYPGILRFHGAWPSKANWVHRLLDVAHPQQNWQVGFSGSRDSHSAFGLVSLYQPLLHIGLSSTDPDLSPGEWEEIEVTLRQALCAGIGGRTCVGYGSSGRLTGDLVYQCALEGQGPAAKLLDHTPEFRPTMFRAAIRGMALRLFGGLTSQENTFRIVDSLFGSLGGPEGQQVGLLATAYTDYEMSLGTYGTKSWEQPIYATSGHLQWRLTRSIGSDDTTKLLSDLLAALHGLAMSLGGFGRGWRRSDHRIFYKSYGKTPIGCHWQWREPDKLAAWIHVQTPADLSQLLLRSQRVATRWLEIHKTAVGKPADWREVIHPERMRIWTRVASDASDSAAIEWFHWSPGSGGHDHAGDPRELKTTVLAGRVNQVGRIWHRLLPLVNTDQSDSSSSAVRSPMPLSTSANPLARPGAATARPASGAMARPSGSNRREAAPRGEVSIPMHNGSFQETLLLFPDPQRAGALSRAFISMMDRGADANFQPLRWARQ